VTWPLAFAIVGSLFALPILIGAVWLVWFLVRLQREEERLSTRLITPLSDKEKAALASWFEKSKGPTQ
jgi:hypothetical protein